MKGENNMNPKMKSMIENGHSQDLRNMAKLIKKVLTERADTEKVMRKNLIFPV